ncbi:MAG: hypothetical protein JO033_15890 [Acidobacteriaceae bacterium]|nr:hypothetical protein [Acidobacteriaceae bacterium]MBV9501555.1 hypothetical protein [Acidobacteriaceae bacterium]
MKKIMIAALGLSMLSGTAVFAQNTAGQTDTSSTMKSTTSKKHSKHHSKKSTDTMSSTTSTTK